MLARLIALRDFAQRLAHDLNEAGLYDECATVQQVVCNIQDNHIDKLSS